MRLEPAEIIDISRVHYATTPQSRRGHHDGVGQRGAPDRTQGLASGSAQTRWHVFDDHGRQDRFANVASSAPPLDVDDRRDDREDAPPNDVAKSLRCSTLAALERNQHPGVEGERHAARRRRTSFDGDSPRHSFSIRSIASSPRGGTPYRSKNASAAANFASRAASSASRAETFPS